MTEPWTFVFSMVGVDQQHVQSFDDWHAAVAACSGFIDDVHPPARVTLKMECENIPIGQSRSITDGTYTFSVRQE